MTSYLIIIHHASLIFTIMQIKPRLLIHIQTIVQIPPDPWPPKVTPDPYEYSSILSIDYFSKFLMGGGLKIFGPRRSPTGTKSDGGGGTCEKNPTEAKTAHLMQN